MEHSKITDIDKACATMLVGSLVMHYYGVVWPKWGAERYRVHLAEAPALGYKVELAYWESVVTFVLRKKEVPYAIK